MKEHLVDIELPAPESEHRALVNAYPYQSRDFLAAVVIGDSDAAGRPSYGWVQLVQRSGGKLIATIATPHKWLVDAIRAGARASCQIYEDLRRGRTRYVRGLKSVIFKTLVPPALRLVPTGTVQQFTDAARVVEYTFEDYSYKLPQHVTDEELKQRFGFTDDELRQDHWHGEALDRAVKRFMERNPHVKSYEAALKAVLAEDETARRNYGLGAFRPSDFLKEKDGPAKPSDAVHPGKKRPLMDRIETPPDMATAGKIRGEAGQKVHEMVLATMTANRGMPYSEALALVIAAMKAEGRENELDTYRGLGTVDPWLPEGNF